ncbi:MAG: fructose-6-phosphate aldolase [Chloroflexi bacterium]|nr:fructose-6-phosphate aldolase [Chloroflexota bacterium]
MLIFLDTANMEEIRQAARLGVVSGITTNPSLVAKERAGDYRAVVREIASIIPGPISAEVLNLETAQGIVRDAREVASWAPNVVVKIPITAAGLEAASALAREGVRTNLTLCFSANQALLAARVGAAYVSPFVGRLDDAGHDGMAVVADIVEIYKRYSFPTQVIAASIRHPMHCVAAAKAGADISTVPYKVLRQMIEHPLTDVGIARFAQDWEQVSAALASRAAL